MQPWAFTRQICLEKGMSTKVKNRLMTDLYIVETVSNQFLTVEPQFTRRSRRMATRRLPATRQRVAMATIVQDEHLPTRL